MTNEELIDKTILEPGKYRAQLLRRLGAAVSASPQPSLTGDQLLKIALKHDRPVAGYQFADKFDFDAIAQELNAQFFAPTPAQEPREATVKTVWMDSIHFYDHLEHDPRAKGLPVYKSADICKADNPCIDTDGHCTALKVFISDVDLWAAQEQPVENSPQQYFCSTCTQYLTVIEAMDTHNQSHDIVRVIPNSPQKGKP